MNTVHRRTEIINILIIRRHTTANELAQEFGVSIRTIQYDIQALTPVYPIYTKQGENGGIFIREDYKPYANSLTPMEVAALHELYDWTEGIHKKVLIHPDACGRAFSWGSVGLCNGTGIPYYPVCFFHYGLFNGT